MNPDDSAQSAASAIAAVNRVVQHELSPHGDDLGLREHLLGVADLLLHRAVLDDLTPVRRAAQAPELGSLAKELDVVSGDDVYDAVARSAERLCDDSAPPDRLLQLLEVMTSTDLPELGRTSTPEKEAAAAAAMDWLGGEAPPTLDADAIAAYLAGRAPEGTAPNVQSVRRISGGFSKATTLLEMVRGGAVEEIVLRQVQPGRNATGLAAEYHVVGFAWARGVPAPEPLWLEPVDNVLGGPFFATRRVPGANVGDVFGPRAGTTDSAPAHGLARALARLHTLDLTLLQQTPVAPMATRDEVLARVEEQRQQVAGVAVVDSDLARPLHELLFAWLRMHAPRELASPVLLHGDPGFHNLMVQDGEVQALLDWERARIGEAEQDLAYVRPHVTPVLRWEDFLATYCAEGGSEPRPDRLAYYAVWHDAWRFAGSYRGKARLFGDHGVVLDAVTGLLHAPRFLLSGLQQAFGVQL